MTVTTVTSPLEQLGLHIDGLEALVRDLDPDGLGVDEAGALIAGLCRGEKLCASGRTLLARVVNDAPALAGSAGITRSDAVQSLAASHTASEQPELADVLRQGSLSGAQVNAVARGAKANPQKLSHLVHVAKTRSVEELRDEARRIVLAAKNPDNLHRRQRFARSLRTWTDDLGMLAGSFRLTPEVGAAFRSLIERQAQRLHREARRAGSDDPYPAHLADALAGMVLGTFAPGAPDDADAGEPGSESPGPATPDGPIRTPGPASPSRGPAPAPAPSPHTRAGTNGSAPAGGNGSAPPRPAARPRPPANTTPFRADVIVDVSYAALMRGVALEGERCDVRGLGPIPVWRAKEIMEDAFLKALLTHGDDVRLVHHVGRRPSAAIKTALQWRYRGCVDCGSSFHLEDDHVDPWTNDGPTSYENLRPRCWPCHRIKTEADRRSGLLGRDPPRRRE